MRCFVISPIGEEKTEVRDHADDLYNAIIKPAMDQCGIEAVRSDHLNEPGRISEQMFRAILSYDLCVVVLTDHNPNVYYELAVAQSAGRPVVILLQKGQKLPFDVQDLRCINYDFRPSQIDNYKHQLIEHVRSIKRAGWMAQSLLEKFESIPGRKQSSRTVKATATVKNKSSDGESGGEKMLADNTDHFLETIPDTLNRLEKIIVVESKTLKQISIKNFGLDLENVMPWLRNNVLVKDILKKIQINYKGLIVDIESDFIKQFIDGKSNIKSTYVKASIDSSELIKNIKSKSLKVEIRAYKILPTFHGFLLNNNHLFISFTEIQANKIFGGNYPYLYFKQDKTSKLKNHYFNMFTSWFDFVWNDSKKLIKIPK